MIVISKCINNRHKAVERHLQLMLTLRGPVITSTPLPSEVHLLYPPLQIWGLTFEFKLHREHFWGIILLEAEQDAFQLQPNDTNSYESFVISSKWTSSMPYGKWSTCSFPHRKFTEISTTGKVSLVFHLHINTFLLSFVLLSGSKAQFARDDPAFLVLLGMWLCCK